MYDRAMYKSFCKREYSAYLAGILGLMLLTYLLLHDLLGGTLFTHCQWDSYTLQALAWRRGAMGLGQDYPWLELAVYQGDWFVSFPPLPSLVLLPLTFIFGENTPNNLLVMLYAMGTAAFAYASLCRAGSRPQSAAFLSLFYVMGCNMMWMSMSGGVWFQAQSLNMLLLTGCLWAAMANRRLLAYTLVALAVGCRPFSACAFFPLAFYFYREDRARGYSLIQSLFGQLPCLIPAALVGGAYMWYNWARFGNPLEFGHNYLPEFTQAQMGQFHPGYLLQNLKNILLRPVTIDAQGRFSFPYFDGFLFYIANPLYLLLAAKAVRDIRAKRMEALRFCLLGAIVLELLLLCAHKTFGGWQFGARYTVDMLPMVLAYLVLDGPWEPRFLEKGVGLFAIAFNLYGALAMTFLYT
ncbi:MAG: hypothetical protein VB049_06290 [Candidatus Pelethousia sp.]|nr:hypothetical protein [Candidatus Pelethousia sp.]